MQTYLKLHFEQDGVLSVLFAVLDEVGLLHGFLGNGSEGLVFLGCRRERENVNVNSAVLGITDATVNNLVSTGCW